MGAREALDALIVEARNLAGITTEKLHLRPSPTAPDRRLRVQIKEASAFKALEDALGVKELGELLDRTGLLNQILNESVDSSAALEILNEARARASKTIALLHLNGVAPFDGSVELEGGFRLVSFTTDEWTNLQPTLESEQLDPLTIMRQTFIEKHDLGLLNTPHRFLLKSSAHKDPLWSGWWRPLLGLALFRPERFADGVRLEVDPRWRVRKEGDFSVYGTELPWGPEDDAPEVWQSYSPCDYEVGEGSERERLRQFVCRVMRAAHRAHKHDDGRIATAAKRFLWASFRLGRHDDWKRGDHDINEQILFNLVRAADGLFLSDVTKGWTKQFKRRVAIASGLPDDGVRDFLGCAYGARSAIAHGKPDPPFVDLPLLHEVVRLAFVGFVGLVESALDPKDLVGTDLPITVRQFHDLAIGGLGEPDRRQQAFKRAVALNRR